jgi:nitroreductase
MNVTEAVNARSSIRAYKPDGVPREILVEILENAARTPSWANTQPWEVFVASGAALERIKKAYAKAYAEKTAVQVDVARPERWTEAAQARTKQLFPDMVRDCGEETHRFGALNQTLFNAPAVVYLCIDKLLSAWSLYDLGAYSQSVMLLARERGLATIPAITLVSFPEILRRELKIPDNLNVAIGIAVGYADEGNAINKFKSGRDSIADTVRFS